MLLPFTPFAAAHPSRGVPFLPAWFVRKDNRSH
jgi:hypothetical protein